MALLKKKHYAENNLHMIVEDILHLHASREKLSRSLMTGSAELRSDSSHVLLS